MASNTLSYGSFPAKEPHDSTRVRLDVPGVSPSLNAAVKDLSRRWPAVPSRELERIRRALLQSEGANYGGGGHQLSEPARALLDLISAGLQRRRRDITPRSSGGGA